MFSKLMVILVTSAMGWGSTDTQPASGVFLPDIRAKSSISKEDILQKEVADQKRLEKRFVWLFNQLQAQRPAFAQWIQNSNGIDYVRSIKPLWPGIVDQFDECKHLFAGWEEFLFMGLCLEKHVVKRLDMVNALQKLVTCLGSLNDQQKASIPHLYDLTTQKARDVMALATHLEMQKIGYDRLVHDQIAKLFTKKGRQVAARSTGSEAVLPNYPVSRSVTLAANVLADEDNRQR